jgi:hypothetical protein
MALPEPAVDSRTYREIITEALARVPVHTPEWNNLGASDPGVTLLQVFAFIAESAIYRANRIPKRNRQKFLRLLGINQRAAQPARGIVSFTAPQLYVLDAGVKLAAGNVPFVTQSGLAVLPVETRMYFKQRVPESRRAEIADRYNRLYASIREPAQPLDFYETQLLAPPAAGALAPALDLTTTVDRSLWIALLAPPRTAVNEVRARLAEQPLTLGVAPALAADGRTLFPAGLPASIARPTLVYEAPIATGSSPNYRALTVLSADDVLAEPGLVELQLPAFADLDTWRDLGPLQAGVGGYPPALDNAQDVARLITWIRIRVPPSDPDATAGSAARVVLSWVGANAARVLQKVHVEGERLPDGTGEPDQVARLANGNVLPEGVVLTVNGEVWTRVEDLADAAPEIAPRAPRHAGSIELPSRVGPNAYVLDPATGEIRYNARPPRGALIVCSYDFGGGRTGDVGIGAVSRIVNPPAGLKVTNPIPTWGAADLETLEEAEERVPQSVRHREVAASREDFHKIVERTPGVEIGRDEILPLMDPDLPNQVAEGNVTVLVIPRTDPQQPEAPRPDAQFLQTVCDYLEPRRVLTTALHIRGPDYRRIGIGIGIQGVPGRAEAPLANDVSAAVANFLSPLIGGFDGSGWPLGKTVDPAEVAAAVSRVPGVARVNGVLIVDENGNTLADGLTLRGLELPRVNPIRVAVGAVPTPAATAPPDDVPALPVPVVPENC